ncbi:MAG: hypothetical protein KDG52_07040 [Rhodocyclaceae bacterium]|nr:hypothetical protein [Rhodocyclaceae bacterium]
MPEWRAADCRTALRIHGTPGSGMRQRHATATATHAAINDTFDSDLDAE